MESFYNNEIVQQRIVICTKYCNYRISKRTTRRKLFKNVQEKLSFKLQQVVFVSISSKVNSYLVPKPKFYVY